MQKLYNDAATRSCSVGARPDDAVVVGLRSTIPGRLWRRQLRLQQHLLPLRFDALALFGRPAFRCGLPLRARSMRAFGR